MSAATVEAAAQGLLELVPGTKQTELLAALRIMAEDLVSPDRLDRLITKEQLMSSSTIQELVEERVQERADLLQRQLDQANKREMAELVQDVTVSRFPDIPGRLLNKIRQISDVATLRQVLIAIAAAPDQAAAQAILEASDH